MQLGRSLHGPVALALLAGTCPAIAGTWTRVALPLDNANVVSMVVAPSRPDRVYLGLNGFGVWRTDDRGASWSMEGSGLPIDARINTLDVSPTNADLALAGVAGSVYRTTDAGGHWVLLGPVATGGTTRAVLIHPALPQVALAGVILGSQPGVYRTTDSGATWSFTSAALGAVGVYDLAADPADSAILLAATSAGMARSTDSGSSWAAGTSTELFSQITWSAADASLVYVRSGLEIHRSTDAGVSFAPMTPPPGDPSAIAAHPVDASLLLAAGTGYGCAPINSSRAYVWKSTDQGGSWTETFRDPQCDTGFPSALAFDPTAPEHVYLGESGQEGRGFRHSATGGSAGSWVESIGDIDNFWVSSLAGTVGGTLYARANRRLFRSAPAVGAWTDLGNRPEEYDALWLEGTEVSDRVPGLLFEWGDAVSGDIAFSVLDRSTDAGVTWGPLFGYPPAFPNIGGILRGLAVNHGSGQTVYAATWVGLYRSDDGGDTYASVNAQSAEHVVVHPGDDLHVFIAGGPDRMAVSFDGGVTTIPRNAGLPATGGMKEVFLEAADPDHLEILYGDGGVYETRDGGLSWAQRFHLEFSGWLYDATWDPASGHVFLATTASGVVTSHPSYEAEGLPTADVRSLYYFAGERTLFVGTARSGLWAQTLDSVIDAPEVAGTVDTFRVSPNPFRSGAAVDFVLPPSGGSISLTVYDAAGRRVRTLATGPQAGGAHRVTWNGRSDRDRPLPAGVYFVRLETPVQTALRKAVMLR